MKRNEDRRYPVVQTEFNFPVDEVAAAGVSNPYATEKLELQHSLARNERKDVYDVQSVSVRRGGKDLPKTERDRRS